MKKDSNRNIAYLLSATISNECLDDISGGSPQAPTAFTPSFRVTGSSFRDHDFVTDARVTF